MCGIPEGRGIVQGGHELELPKAELIGKPSSLYSDLTEGLEVVGDEGSGNHQDARGAARRAMLAERFASPAPKTIDKRLILGATLFGRGWGAVGLCPGPAITPALWNPSVLAFTAALFASVAMYELDAARFARSAGWVEVKAGVWDNLSTAGESS